jgi:hypothetical protein
MVDNTQWSVVNITPPGMGGRLPRRPMDGNERCPEIGPFADFRANTPQRLAVSPLTWSQFSTERPAMCTLYHTASQLLVGNLSEASLEKPLPVQVPPELAKQMAQDGCIALEKLAGHDSPDQD